MQPFARLLTESDHQSTEGEDRDQEYRSTDRLGPWRDRREEQSHQYPEGGNDQEIADARIKRAAFDWFFEKVQEELQKTHVNLRTATYGLLV